MSLPSSRHISFNANSFENTFWFKGSDSGTTVHLKEGEVISIRIEVAADGGGTVKNCFIHVTRLSFSDALLSGVELSAVQIFTQLKFAANVAKWSVNVPFSHFSAELTHVVADKNILVRIKGGQPEKTLGLNFGERLDIEVEV